jgi:hypothetical protein
LGQQLQLPRDLLLEFFATFARFEYALKESGHSRVAWHGGVEPNWDSFAKSLDQDVDKILTAGQYLLSHPPKRHILSNSVLDWADTAAGTSLTDLFASVRRVRNNLFHGGKFADGSVNNPDRNRRLLNDALEVIHALLAHPQALGTKAAFEA